MYLERPLDRKATPYVKIRKTQLALLAGLFLAACSQSASAPGAAGLELQPANSEVSPGDTVMFAALNGDTDTPTTWKVLETGGGVVDESGTYVAPDVEGTFHVVAAKSATTTAMAAVVVKNGRLGNLTIRPRAAAVASGAQLQFTAQARGAAAEVTWAIEEGATGGTITASGLYTAGAAAGIFSVVARSVADPSQVDRATVTVTAPPPRPRLRLRLRLAMWSPRPLATRSPRPRPPRPRPPRPACSFTWRRTAMTRARVPSSSPGGPSRRR